MTLYRNKLYIILASATTAGYIWLIYKVLKGNLFEEEAFSACMIKQATGIPCPSCGTTRSIAALLQAHWMEALYWNPFGLIVLLLMMVIPVWLAYDLILKKDKLFIWYQKTEKFISQPKIAIPLIILVILNWIWNITKGL